MTLSAVKLLELKLAKADADDEAGENEPAEGTPADKKEDQAEALKALQDAVDAVKEAFAELSK
jgi:hypothetical protein